MPSKTLTPTGAAYLASLTVGLDGKDPRRIDEVYGALRQLLDNDVAIKTTADSASTTSTSLSTALPLTMAIRAMAADVSVGSLYEIQTYCGRKYLALKRRTTFPVAAADIKSAAPTGYTWLNSSNLDSADQNTTTANAEYWNLSATNSVWNSATQSAPCLYKTALPNLGTVQQFTGRVTGNMDADFEAAGIIIFQSGATNRFLRIAVAYSGGQVVTTSWVDSSGSASSASQSITSGQRDAGIWLQIRRAGLYVSVYYNTTDTATQPTSWTRLATIQLFTALTDSCRYGRFANTGNTSNNFTASFLAFNDAGMGAQVEDGIQQNWGAIPYDTSSTAQQLLRIDLGYNGAPAISQTLLRSWLASRENMVDPSTTGTLTYATYQGNTDSASYGSYNAAASVTSASTGRYFYLAVKMTSDGTNPVSFLLD